MRTKSILTTAAIALVAGLGSASAGEQFTTLDGVTAVAMSNGGMDAVYGAAAHFQLITSGRAVGRKGTFVASMHAAGFVANGGGLRKAEDHSGVIDVCGYSTGC